MAAILLPRRLLLSQPATAVLDRSTAMGRNCLVAVAAGTGRETARGGRLVRGANTTLTAGLHGVAYQGSAVDSNLDFGATGGLDTILPVSESFAIFMRVYISAATTQQILFADYDGAVSATSQSIYLQVTAAGAWEYVIVDSGGIGQVVTGGTVTVGWHDILCIHAVGSSMKMWVDKAVIGETAFAANRRNGTAFRVGSAGAYTTTICLLGQYPVFAIFKGLEAAGVLLQTSNPWEMFFAPRVLTALGAVPLPLRGTLGQFDPQLRAAAWF